MAFEIKKEINLGSTRLSCYLITEACPSLNYYHIITLKMFYEVYNSLKGFKKRWVESTTVRKLGRND